MKKISVRLFFIMIFFSCIKLYAQQDVYKETIPAFVTDGNDTLKTVVLSDVYIYPPESFKYSDDEKKYQKLVRDVKKTLPYAKMIHATLIETYEYIQTLPDDGSREAHLKRMEKELFSEYKPVLKKLTMSQGKLLIKLVDRECNQSSYNLLKAFLGPIRAGFWNVFAGLLGGNLKSTWDPNGKDAAAERVVELVEMGLL